MNDFLEIDAFRARPNRVVGRCRQTCFLAFTRTPSVQCSYAGPLWVRKNVFIACATICPSTRREIACLPIDRRPGSVPTPGRLLDFRSADFRRGDHALPFYGGRPQSVARMLVISGFIGMAGHPKCSRPCWCSLGLILSQIPGISNYLSVKVGDWVYREDRCVSTIRCPGHFLGDGIV